MTFHNNILLSNYILVENKMKKPLWLMICSIFLQLSTQITIAQNQIPFSAISNGGEETSNTSFSLSSTVGEAFIGRSINASNQKYLGFWFVYNQSKITSVDDKVVLPTEFKLEQNYPNPFNPSTVIKFGVPERTNVLIKIYDILGSEIITLVNEEMEAGWYKKEFNASAYSTGVYIYRMQAGNFVSTKKMLMIK
jgi:hypothetical protein